MRRGRDGIQHIHSTVSRVRLAILGASPCHLCRANCCKQNGHEFAVLLRDDEIRRFAPFIAS